jgi:hypothetical protein
MQKETKMNRIPFAIVILASLSARARAGWDVEFELAGEFVTADRNASESSAASWNPLYVHWNVIGIEESAITSYSHFCRTSRPVAPQTATADDIRQITAGARPLSPHRDARTESQSVRESMTSDLWPGTKAFLQPCEDESADDPPKFIGFSR